MNPRKPNRKTAIDWIVNNDASPREYMRFAYPDLATDDPNWVKWHKTLANWVYYDRKVGKIPQRYADDPAVIQYCDMCADARATVHTAVHGDPMDTITAQLEDLARDMATARAAKHTNSLAQLGKRQDALYRDLWDRQRKQGHDPLANTDAAELMGMLLDQVEGLPRALLEQLQDRIGKVLQ